MRQNVRMNRSVPRGASEGGRSRRQAQPYRRTGHAYAAMSRPLRVCKAGMVDPFTRSRVGWPCSVQTRWSGPGLRQAHIASPDRPSTGQAVPGWQRRLRATDQRGYRESTETSRARLARRQPGTEEGRNYRRCAPADEDDVPRETPPDRGPGCPPPVRTRPGRRSMTMAPAGRDASIILHRDGGAPACTNAAHATPGHMARPNNSSTRTPRGPVGP